MKVKYNHQLPFSHRFISHMDEQEASDLIRKSNNARDVRQNSAREAYHSSKKQNDNFETSMTPQETKILTEFNYNRESYPRHEAPVQTRFADIDVSKKKVKQSDVISAERRQSNGPADNLLAEFQTSEMTSVSSLRDGYLRLWFERLAVDANFAVLQAENRRKDDIINQLKQQLGQKSSPSPSFFASQTPDHSSSGNKTAVHNQSTSLQSHTASNQASSSGLGHWNSLHPNKNFNMGVNRTNA